MRFRALAVLAVSATLACASSGQAGESGEQGPGAVTMVVINEYSYTATAYVIWGNNRVRLGDVGGGRTRTFSTPRRGNTVALGVEATGAPPAATGVRGGDPSAPYFVSQAVPIQPGEGIEWRFSGSGVTYLRLPTQ